MPSSSSPGRRPSGSRAPGSRPPGTVFGADRVRRLRIALGVAAGLAVVLAVVVFASSVGRDDPAPAWIAGTAIGVLVALGCVLAWRMLEVPDRRAKGVVVAMGGVIVLLALMTAPFLVVSLPFALLGMAVLFLSISADEA